QLLDDVGLADDCLVEFLGDAAIAVVEPFDGGEIAFDAWPRGGRRGRGDRWSRRCRRDAGRWFRLDDDRLIFVRYRWRCGGRRGERGRGGGGGRGVGRGGGLEMDFDGFCRGG